MAAPESRRPRPRSASRPPGLPSPARRATLARMATGPLLVMVAGAFGAPTAERRAANLLALNLAAAEVARRGHVPLIGVNAALPVLEAAGHGVDHRWMMEICLALAARCDACLRVSRSPGADREAELLRAAGRPVWESLDDVPQAAGMHVQETRPLLHFDDLAVGDRYETGAIR